MIKHKAFLASCSLADLQAAMNELDGPRKALIGIGNQAGETIGSYDTEKKGNRNITCAQASRSPIRRERWSIPTLSTSPDNSRR